MKQVLQSASGGPIRVVEVPRPAIGATEVLVQTAASVISSGTERAVTALARSGLVSKARARPDLVRKVMQKARTDGPAAAARAVRARLSDDIALGYSAAGIVVEVGEAVPGGISPGQLVATGGAGKASHAEFQAVPGLLCTPVPDGVPAADAAFATIASVALHGLRLSEVGPGSRVVVIGLGLVGQLAARLAEAAGCEVTGVDVAARAVARLAGSTGALALAGDEPDLAEILAEWTRGRGADSVLIAAATPSSDAILQAAAISRDRATVVVLGDVGLELDRRQFYEKELTVRFARSYGPGRYDTAYEDWAVDWPAGVVRWTEGRNQEAIVAMLAAGRLSVGDLVTHRFPLEVATDAYGLIETGAEDYCAIQLTYPAPAGPLRPERPVTVSPRSRAQGLGVGLIGAGAFARGTLVPALRAAGFGRLVSVASSSGVSAVRLAGSAGFERALSGGDAVCHDPEVDVVVIATPHDTHAELVTSALRAGKHVFCEKPLALTDEELDQVERAWHESAGVLWVGFNRRWSSPIRMVADHFRSVGIPGGPLVINYRVNAGPAPAGHWYNDRRQGGRLVGEACHFVDTCAAIVGSAAEEAVAVGSGQHERLLADDFAISLRYGGGSIAAITYASGGPPGLEKERVEVLGRGRSATVEGFKTVVLNGETTRFGAPEKGYRRQMSEFRRSVLGEPAPTEAMLASSRATLLAAASLATTD